MPDKLWLPGIVIFCSLLGATAQVLFKSAATEFPLSLALILNWRVLTGIGLYSISLLLFLFTLHYDNVSRLYPLVATSYVWLTIFAVVFLREKLSLPTVIGIGLVALGVAVLSLPSSR